MNYKLFFAEPSHEFENRLPPGSLAASPRGFAFCVADPIGSTHESTCLESPRRPTVTHQLEHALAKVRLRGLGFSRADRELAS
jgi:hypothetical protein